MYLIILMCLHIFKVMLNSVRVWRVGVLLEFCGVAHFSPNIIEKDVYHPNYVCGIRTVWVIDKDFQSTKIIKLIMSINEIKPPNRRGSLQKEC